MRNYRVKSITRLNSPAYLISFLMIRFACMDNLELTGSTAIEEEARGWWSNESCCMGPSTVYHLSACIFIVIQPLVLKKKPHVAAYHFAETTCQIASSFLNRSKIIKCEISIALWKDSKMRLREYPVSKWLQFTLWTDIFYCYSKLKI